MNRRNFFLKSLGWSSLSLLYSVGLIGTVEVFLNKNPILISHVYSKGIFDHKDFLARIESWKYNSEFEKIRDSMQKNGQITKIARKQHTHGFITKFYFKDLKALKMYQAKVHRCRDLSDFLTGETKISTKIFNA